MNKTLKTLWRRNESGYWSRVGCGDCIEMDVMARSIRYYRSIGHDINAAFLYY